MHGSNVQVSFPPSELQTCENAATWTLLSISPMVHPEVHERCIPDLPVQVLAETERFVAVLKPAGMPCQVQRWQALRLQRPAAVVAAVGWLARALRRWPTRADNPRGERPAERRDHHVTDINLDHIPNIHINMNHINTKNALPFNIFPLFSNG